MKRLLIVLLLLVAACGEGGGGDAPSPPWPTINLGGWEYLREVTLSDGTRCAVATSGGVSCDWNAR
jgi:hypothetical protein